jgi:hypothetical protein
VYSTKIARNESFEGATWLSVASTATNDMKPTGSSCVENVKAVHWYRESKNEEEFGFLFNLEDHNWS